jgi:hypothetical protein
MPRKLLLIILLGLVLCGPAALADGDSYPGGPLGTRITRLPYTISAPGAYYLGGNLSYAGGDGITITSDHVTLDLMGYTMTGSGGSNTGILMEGRKNVEIRNGTLSGWGHGIFEAGPTGLGHRIINVRAEGNDDGVLLWSKGHLIKGCRATGAGTSYIGLFIQGVGTISGCQVNNFNYGGIFLDSCGLISGNVVLGPADANTIIGISTGYSSLVIGNEVTNAPHGIDCTGSANIIGNTVTANSGQIGINISTTEPTLLDQNTVMGAGTHYQGITTGKTVTRNNAGL